MIDAAIVVAVVSLFGVFTGTFIQRRTERDKITEDRVMDLLNRQDTKIAELERRDAEKDQRIQKQDAKITEVAAENKKLWRLFSMAIEHLADWIRWERDGRHGWPPETPRALQEHLPDEISEG